jgi:hypothetical protein
MRLNFFTHWMITAAGGFLLLVWGWVLMWLNRREARTRSR